ncbi:arylesterase [Parvularcula sp. IMCC14364]|uniref:arylesterase n=1 Tax=Parvularcula sp. IMCC14364 TaxID=3067902 RepID=UPI0027411948|nr:arylesterase [Parvularcula sp. IMCC14364]
MRLSLSILFLLLTACGEAAPDVTAGETRPPDTSKDMEVFVRVTTDKASTDTEKSDTFRLVMLGDSITAGFGLSNPRLLTQSLDAKLDTFPTRARGDIDVINAGVSGDRMQDAAARFDWSVGPEVDGVLIALGGNDLLRGIDPAVTRAALDEMLDKATSRGIWVGIAGLRAPGNATATFAAEYNAVFDELSMAYCVPLLENFLAGVIGDPALNQQDGIHPTPEGVTVIVSTLGPWLHEALQGEHDPC